MIRRSLTKKAVGQKNNFRWRGGEVSRLEGFSDAVFAFAITLLVVSLEVPKSFSDLTTTMLGFFPFSICFAFLVFIWYNHYIFFRRYGLQDVYVIILNALLLFVVLYYIYPLKFLFSFLANQIFGLHPAGVSYLIKASETPSLMTIYSSGYFAIFFIFFLLHKHALSKKEKLNLSDIEIIYTRFSINADYIHISVSLLSILIALSGGDGLSSMAGFIYALIGPLYAIPVILMNRRFRKLNTVLS